MRDIWGFLLQTLTGSAVAVLLLCVKALFRDKLSPRWQFAVWGLLALRLLIPVGSSGTALFDGLLLVESAKSFLAGEYTLTRVTAPIPLLPESAAMNLWQFLFCLYLTGVLWLLGRYFISYIRLRLALRQGNSADDAMRLRIESVAQRYGLRSCPAVAVEGLQSAFICGTFRPVLALPADRQVDDKILLHELLHLKYRDSLWGLLIALLRSLHWCNPLLWYCADRAGNDLESLCDQRVLERLEGEERRAYGNILLEMANDTYARMPGTSSMANGGKNIRRRIETIVHFKLFPKGMELVSVCMVVLLALPMFSGAVQRKVYSPGAWLPERLEHSVSMASARVSRCTTYAGALDSYAKALLTQNPVYRAMCAPLAQQAELAKLLQQGEDWEKGLPGILNLQQGYVIYNLQPKDGGYEGVLVMELQDPPAGVEPVDGAYDLLVQQVRAQREEENWIVLPMGKFETLQTEAKAQDWRSWGVEGLPWYVYAAEAANFRIEARLQYIFKMDNYVKNSANGTFVDQWLESLTDPYAGSFDYIPRPNAEFDTAGDAQFVRAVYLGEEDKKDSITQFGLSYCETKAGEERPNLPGAPDERTASSTKQIFTEEGRPKLGAVKSTKKLEPGWKSPLMISGSSGADVVAFSDSVYELPEQFSADLYVNKERVAKLTLTLKKDGGSQ